MPTYGVALLDHLCLNTFQLERCTLPSCEDNLPELLEAVALEVREYMLVQDDGAPVDFADCVK
jgi:hypothetical protein